MEMYGDYIDQVVKHASTVANWSKQSDQLPTSIAVIIAGFRNLVFISELLICNPFIMK